MVRQAIFSAIGARIVGMKGLDLFAGSGAMGLEALSRGAQFVQFVDHSDLAIAAIRENLSELKITTANVLIMDYQRALETFKKEKTVFDVVFLDPPYVDKIVEPIISQLLNFGLLSTNGIIVAETLSDISFDETLFQQVRRYRYGRTRIAIIWR
jgi:16S rRNA (guanine(966)-N(2))-methyltransferase RsmD